MENSSDNTDKYLFIFFFLLRERSTNKHGRRIAPPVNNYLEYLDVLLLQASFFFHLMGLILPLHFAVLS